MNKTVSIISASFNDEDHILATYESIQAQTFTDWEWIVTDDCSNDKTYELIKRISDNDPRVNISRNPANFGSAVSRNNSISRASGAYLAFIDSDDLWHPEKLERQLAFMGENISFTFTAYDLIDKTGNSLGKTVDLNQSGLFTYEDMLRKKATLGCSTVILRSETFPKLEMPMLRTGQDYATWLGLLRTGEVAYVLPEILTSYRILPGSISRNKVKKAKRQWQIYREVEGLRFFKSLECFLFYAWRAVFRK
ncbi:glycosyltransferase family 2 protein [Paraglaciecola chathamensis]|uniref:Glycosyltransferase family 2 protein n=1 Tax=Paraglaciecola chathamensis TaxID=368405 RepID=A0ABS0W9F7_9ALTE|nr:glycosyltransferase family 2 protein [Paraglaciecola chathamensis]MBJ2135406.1 glycosyltransferase family 2 protein [Paraglaciecola chathamensis]